MNRRFSPKRALIRSWWRTVRATEVFPIPPAPIRATGSRFSASPTTFSTSSARPKQSLGAGGGDSPRYILWCCETGEIFQVWAVVSVILLMGKKSNPPSGFCRRYLLESSTCFDGYPQLSFGYPQPLFECPQRRFEYPQQPYEYQQQPFEYP